MNYFLKQATGSMFQLTGKSAQSSVIKSSYVSKQEDCNNGAYKITGIVLAPELH